MADSLPPLTPGSLRLPTAQLCAPLCAPLRPMPSRLAVVQALCLWTHGASPAVLWGAEMRFLWS